MIAPQMVSGLLQKVAMTSMPDVMAEQGSKYFDQFAGGLTPEQRDRLNEGIRQLRERQESGATASVSGNEGGGIIAVKARAVVGENKNNPMISFYAAAIGVMFLLFTASGAAGALLDEAESGTLDRVLSSRVTMTSLLLGKLTYNSLLAFSQLVVMFLWGWAVFKLDFWSHIPGIRRDGRLHGGGRGLLRHVAGEHLPDARSIGRALNAGHSGYVLHWRQHVPALPDAGRDAEGRVADD